MKFVPINLADKMPETNNFYWHEFLFLRSWQFHAYPNEEIATNLQQLALVLQWIRDYFQSPIKITSGWRPPDYNAFIKGARRSAHMTGEAVDFKVAGYSADDVRHQLLPFLDRLNIRMEDHSGSWIHIDTKPSTKYGRYFKP